VRGEAAGRVQDEAAGSPVRATPDRIYSGHLWMSLQDLSGYILLGDPAARVVLPATATA
jgi:hypothetical protein